MATLTPGEKWAMGCATIARDSGASQEVALERVLRLSTLEPSRLSDLVAQAYQEV